MNSRGHPVGQAPRFRRDGRNVEMVGYNRASADIVDRFALHDKTGVELGVIPH